MSALFESEEATTVRGHRAPVPTARRVIVLLLAVWTGVNVYSVPQIVQNVSSWWAHRHVDSLPIHNATSLVVHVVAFGLLVELALRLRRRRVREAAPVLADERGLLTEGTLVVAREDITSVEVTTDPDLGFATVVYTRKGASLVVPLRTERSAHALASALSPEHDAAKLAFDGISGSRATETILAVLAVVLLVALASNIGALIPEHIGRWLEAKLGGDRPYTPFYWLRWLLTFAPFVVGGLASIPLARPIARRLQRGRIVVHGTGISMGRREIPLQDIAHVEVAEESAVSIALKNGKSVRAAFAADRPLVERDLFVARVREVMAATSVPSYPSAETSGVRVALSQPSEVEMEQASEVDEPERRAMRGR